MANETVTPPTQADPKTTTNNIVKGVNAKANGTSQQPPIQKDASKEIASVDPNAGKEKYVVRDEQGQQKEIWLLPEQARAYVQKGISFEPKMDQFNRLQKETSAFLQTLMNDPMKILTDKRIGLTPEKVMEKILGSNVNDQFKEKIGQWYYENVVEPMKLSPQELEARENKKKLSEYEEKEKTLSELRLQQENNSRIESAMNQIKMNIAEAMKESGLPNNDTPLGAEMARMVADVMRVAHFQQQMITPKAAIELVKRRIRDVQQAWYDTLDEETIVKEIGEANAEKVKKYFLKLAKNADNKVPNQKSTPRPKNGERKVTSLDDFHDYLAERKKEG